MGVCPRFCAWVKEELGVNYAVPETVDCEIIDAQGVLLWGAVCLSIKDVRVSGICCRSTFGSIGLTVTLRFSQSNPVHGAARRKGIDEFLRTPCICLPGGYGRKYFLRSRFLKIPRRRPLAGEFFKKIARKRPPTDVLV